jgi:hypothetical protein
VRGEVCNFLAYNFTGRSVRGIQSWWPSPDGLTVSGVLLPVFEFLQDIVHLQAIGSVSLLSAFVVLTTMLQQRALRKSSQILQTAPDRIKSTELYGSAEDYLARRQVPSLFFNPTFSIPIWFLFAVVLFCSLASYFGAELFAKSKIPSYILGGALAADQVGQASLTKYQSETVFIGTMAFLGAYLWVISSLIVRINNFDTSPITYYFLACRILTACIVAGIARHIFEALPFHGILYNDNKEPVGLAVLGFLIGWNPTLWIRELVNRGSRFLSKGLPSQRWPAEKDMPENMTLLMIQGLVDDKISRLMELDVDNCQKLACENAVLIWLRTSYNLEVVVDWVAQAQLSLLFEAEKIQKLRRNGIRDIFSYFDMISDEASLSSMQQILEVKSSIISRHRAVIASHPCYQRLDELRRALIPALRGDLQGTLPDDETPEADQVIEVAAVIVERAN